MIDFEYWWLLAFPLFFGLGWLAARIDIKHLLSESRALPVSYFKGLNFLLNEQPDQAVEAFIEVANRDTESVELQFILGSLFRRRGEVERAIRMHQSLLERTDAADSDYLSALYELAQDYFKAGLFDRAEQLLMQLQGSRHGPAALQHLLVIYEQEREWDQAIAAAWQLAEVSTKPYQKEIAQFYCERAAAEIVDGRLEAARHSLAEALKKRRECVRAILMLGEMEVAAGRHEAAIAIWRQIEMQALSYLSLAGEKLVASYRALGRVDECLDLLRGYLAKHFSQDLLDIAYRLALELHGGDFAYRLVRDEVRRNPSLQGLDTLLDIQQPDAAPERRQDLQLIKNLVHDHTQRLAFYRCDACGFMARRFYWRCPACGGWETYNPRKLEEQGTAAPLAVS